MGYRELTESERADRGRKLADALEHLHNEENDQLQAKKAMAARILALKTEIASLKTEVRSGKEWVEDQGALDLA